MRWLRPYSSSMTLVGSVLLLALAVASPLCLACMPAELLASPGASAAEAGDAAAAVLARAANAQQRVNRSAPARGAARLRHLVQTTLLDYAALVALVAYHPACQGDERSGGATRRAHVAGTCRAGTVPPQGSEALLL